MEELCICDIFQQINKLCLWGLFTWANPEVTCSQAANLLQVKCRVAQSIVVVDSGTSHLISAQINIQHC
jgi:hypothetical protein